MKAAVFIFLTVSGLGNVTGAMASETSFFDLLQPVIRQCVTLPYVKQEGRRVYRNLVSHCDQLKVVRDESRGRGREYRAVLNWSGRVFQIAMTPSQQSDGDFFDVAIREKSTGKVQRMRNVLAYGDILLGVLEGSTEGLKSVRVLP